LGVVLAIIPTTTSSSDRPAGGEYNPQSSGRQANEYGKQANQYPI